MLTRLRRGLARWSLIVLALALAIWTFSQVPARAHGGGGGGGHGGGFGGGFGGGHMGGFGGFGGGFGGMGGFYRGGFGGLGYRGLGFGYPFFGFGLGGFGWGYPYYGYGYGYPYYGYGYGYPYNGYGYGYPYYGYGYGYGYPYYSYGLAYGLPAMGYSNLAPAAGFSYSPAYVAPGSGATAPAPNGKRILGIDEEPVNLANGRKGMKITNVYAGTAAERAGLQVGDVLRSVNGYLTEQRGNLAWIIANAAPNDVLRMNVHTAKDGDRTITATLP